MPHKKINPRNIEQSRYHIYNPSDVKQTIEIEAKPRPKPEDLEIVEKIGDEEKIKKGRKKATKTSRKKSTKKTSKRFTKSIKPMVFKSKKLKKDGYVLVITEKPQAAEKIAAALGDGKDRKINKPGRVSYYELERGGKKVIQ